MLVGFEVNVVLPKAQRCLLDDARFKSLRLHEGHEARRCEWTVILFFCKWVLL